MTENTQSLPERQPVPYSAPAESSLSRSQIAKATDFLLDSNRIGSVKHHYEKHRRYVVVSVQTLFERLVALYVPLMLTQWPYLRRYMEQYPAPPNVTPWLHLTRNYIAAWIHDLYPSIREAVKKLSPLAFSQYYLAEIMPYSYEYDEFLIRLNASLRPTHIRGTLEDALYIPILLNKIIDFESNNPFNIPNWTLDFTMVQGLICIMSEKKTWRLSTVVTDTLGRPFWLFDWHNERCCSWFPAEGNYTMEDVTLAYIIGAACTPKLAPKDIDSWQPIPEGADPVENIQAFERVDTRSFFGSYEVRRAETRNTVRRNTAPTLNINEPSRRRRTVRTQRHGKATSKAPIASGSEPQGLDHEEEEEAEELLIPQFRLIDWTYYNLVVIIQDDHTRSGALKMLVFN